DAVLDVGEQVAGKQNGLAAAAELEDEILDLARADGIETGGGLIKDEQFGIVDERLGDADAAGHALGVLAHGAELDGGEADHVEQFIDAALALALREFEELAVIVQRLAGVEEGVEVGLFGQVADATLDAD